MGSMMIACNIRSLVQTVPIAYSTSCSTLIGICIGEGKAQQAKRYYAVSHFSTLLFTALEVILLVTLRDPIQSLFTDSISIQAALTDIWPWFIYAVIANAPATIANSAIRATD